MTNLEILQSRVVELITALLEDTRQCDHDYSFDRAKRRYELAISWQQHYSDITGLFKDLYFRSIVIGLNEALDGSLWDCEDPTPAVDLLGDFTLIRDCTENSFIAPVILFSASLLNWPLISSQCIDLFFQPDLMGGFTQIDDAIDFHQQALEHAMEMAELGEEGYERDPFDEE
jgi:hypothetical protein